MEDDTKGNAGEDDDDVFDWHDLYKQNENASLDDKHDESDDESEAFQKRARRVDSVRAFSAPLGSTCRCTNCPYKRTTKGQRSQRLTTLQRYRLRLHVLLEDPSSSLFARRLNIFILVLIFISSISVILETVESIEDFVLWFYLEYFVVIVFTAEYLLRLVACQSIIRFHFKTLNLIDIMAILPLYIELIWDVQDVAIIRILRIVRLVRFIRAFRTPRYAVYVRILRMTVRKSRPGLKTLSFLLGIACLVFASVMFPLEEKESDPQSLEFSNVFASLWWSIQSTTAEGYGDIVPVSILGKIWASITCSLGVIVIALPITIVMSVFADSFHQVTSEQLLPSEVISKLYKHQKGLKKMFHDMQNSPELQQEAADGDHMATMECIDMLGDLVVKQLNALRTFLDVQIKREKIYENTNYLMEQQVS